MTVLGKLPSPARTSRLLNAAAPDLATHLRINGPLPWRGGPGGLIADVQAAGLTGRGGAGVETWRRLATAATGERPVVVANAADGDPCSTKDATLLTRCPHLVLDGLQLAVEAIGATAVYVYVPPGPAADAARAALGERAVRYDRYPVRVVEAVPAFTAGEESVVLARIGGRRTLPFNLTVHDGLRGRTALVHNVETLAHLAQIARYGPGWFRRLGTPDEPGTFLASVTGPVNGPGVHEVPIGIPISDLIALAGGPTEPLQAVLVGGFLGTWLPYDTLGRTPLSHAALRPLGGSPGSGAIQALPASVCGLRSTAAIVRYLCGHGGARRHGLPALADHFDALALAPEDSSARTVTRILELSTMVTGRGAGRLVRTALDTFDAEVRHHLAHTCTETTRPG